MWVNVEINEIYWPQAVTHARGLLSCSWARAITKIVSEPMEDWKTRSIKYSL